MAGNTEEQDNNTTEVSRKAYIIWNAVFVASLGFIGITGFNLALDNARHTEQLKRLQDFADEGPRSTKQDRLNEVQAIYKHLDARLRPHDDHLQRAETGYSRIRLNERDIEKLKTQIDKVTEIQKSLDGLRREINRHGGIEAHAVANQRLNGHDQQIIDLQQRLRQITEYLNNGFGK